MKRILAIAVAGLLGLACIGATSPTFYGNLVGGTATLSSPLPALSGGLGPQPGPTIPSGHTLIFFGDSITYGYGANNTLGSCTVSPPTSPCFADLVTTFYSGTEVNYGTVSSCLEATTTSGSTCYTVPAGINLYTADLLPYAGNNGNYFYILYGTNDIGQYLQHADTQVSLATYKADLQTIVSALIAAGTPANQIILGQIPYGAPSATSSSLLFAFDGAIAEVAQKNGTLLANTYTALAQCATTNNAPSSCMYDTLHPNNTGHANLAAAFEGANYINAIAGGEASQFINGLLNGTYPLAGTTAHFSGTPNVFGTANSATEFDIGGSNILNGTAVWRTNYGSAAGITGVCFSVSEFGTTHNADLTLYCNNGGALDGSLGVKGGVFSDTGIHPGDFGNGGAWAPSYSQGGSISETIPRIISGSCAVTAPSTVCTFPGSFTFASTGFTCPGLSIEGSTPQSAPTYNTKTTTGITIYITTSATVDYLCSL